MQFDFLIWFFAFSGVKLYKPLAIKERTYVADRRHNFLCLTKQWEHQYSNVQSRVGEGLHFWKVFAFFLVYSFSKYNTLNKAAHPSQNFARKKNLPNAINLNHYGERWFVGNIYQTWNAFQPGSKHFKNIISGI